MLVSFEINWLEAATICSGLGGTEPDLFEISGIKGNISIQMGNEVLSFAGSTVLIDLLQIINSFSEHIIIDFQGKTIPINIDDEPEIYVSIYQDVIELYRYSPQRTWQFPNPILETMTHAYAMNVSRSLKDSVLQQIEFNAPQIFITYSSALLK